MTNSRVIYSPVSPVKHFFFITLMEKCTMNLFYISLFDEKSNNLKIILCYNLVHCSSIKHSPSKKRFFLFMVLWAETFLKVTKNKYLIFIVLDHYEVRGLIKFSLQSGNKRTEENHLCIYSTQIILKAML